MYLTAKTVLIYLLINANFLSAGPLQELDTSKEVPSAKSVNTLMRSVIETVIETVLKEHITPPTRQQMVLEVIRGISQSSGMQASLDLANCVSDAKGKDQVYDLLATELARLGADGEPSKRNLNAIESALEKTMLGGLEIISRSNAIATEQIAANRYVGIGVQISSSEKGKGLLFTGVFEDGPASDAGIRAKDYLEAVDGISTIDRPLEEVIPLLRGTAGTNVVLTVRTAEQPPRELNVIRRVVPIKSVSLVEKNVERGALFVQVDRVAASSLNEIQKLVAQTEEAGLDVRLVVLDLRRTSVDNLHYLHLLADGILDEANIGGVQSRTGVRTLKTENGTILGRVKVAILYTPGLSDALDMLAYASSDAGMQVFFMPHKSDINNWRAIENLTTIREAIPVLGTDFFIGITIHRLLDKHGTVVTSEPSERLNTNLINMSVFKKNNESELGAILRDYDF